MRLAGRRILITGGGSGIGLATAERFVTEGAQVAILDRSPQSLARVKNALPGVVALACDVSQEADVQQAVPVAAAHLQGLDGVCNVAGIGTGVDQFLHVDGNSANTDITHGDVVNLDLAAFVRNRC